MSWIKFDTDAATEDGAAHAAIATAMRRNANAYPTQLARSVSHYYERFSEGVRTDGPQFIATHPQIYAGNWYLVDMGQNATQLSVRLHYRTATATESVRVRVQVPWCDAIDSFTLPASTSPTTADALLFFPAPTRGVQRVHVAFRSEIAAEPDAYPPFVLSATGSQIYGYQPAAPGVPWSGRMAKYLIMPNVGDTSTNTDVAGTRIFVGYAAPAPVLDSGGDIGVRLDVWPDVETQPAVLPTLADPSKGGFATTHDLGICYLMGIAFAVTGNSDTSYTPDYAHDGMSAAGQAQYQTPQLSAVNRCAHTLAIAPDPFGDWHGQILASKGEITRVVVPQTGKAIRLRVEARIYLIATEVDGQVPNVTLTVYDDVGAPLVDFTTTATQVINGYFQPRRTIAPTANTSLVLANMQHVSYEWGMGSLSSFEDYPTEAVFLAVTTPDDVDAGRAYVVAVSFDVMPSSIGSKALVYACGIVAYTQQEVG